MCETGIQIGLTSKLPRRSPGGCLVEHDDLLRRVVDLFEELGTPYMVVGSIASSAYGEPRATQDVDIVADLKYGNIDAICQRFGLPEYYLNPHAIAQAIQRAGQFNIIQSTTGDKADIMMLKEGAWRATELGRRRKLRILPDRDIYVARPEDVILAKMDFYREGGSEKHLRDIAGILRISGDEVDRQYVAQWAGRLGLTEIWETILSRLNKP